MAEGKRVWCERVWREEGGPRNLVLTRTPGTAVLVGDDIEVAVVSIRGDKVRLAFRAPAGVVIDREEVRDRRVASLVAGGKEGPNRCSG